MNILKEDAGKLLVRDIPNVILSTVHQYNDDDINSKIVESITSKFRRRPDHLPWMQQ